jgi:DNA-binding IclR family transcriptional regulator
MSQLPSAPSGRQPQAIRMALAMLRTVAQAGPGITAKQISAELNLPPATTYRILNLLVGEGYLVRLADLRGFALGTRVAELVGASQFVAPPLSLLHRLGEEVQPVVLALRASIGLPVTLATYTDHAVEIAVRDPRRPVSVDGLAVTNLHASAIGRLLLAATPNWNALLTKPILNRLTPKTIVDRARLDSELIRIRRDALAVQLGELHTGVGCIAVPVTDPDGSMCASLTVSADASAIERRLTELVTRLRSAAGDLRELWPALGCPPGPSAASMTAESRNS